MVWLLKLKPICSVYLCAAEKMLTGVLLVCVLVLHNVPIGLSSSLLCGQTKELEMGGEKGVGAALALALVRPPGAAASRAPCQLTLTAPEATAFIVRLIDVKESVMLDRGSYGDVQTLKAGGSPGRKWSARSVTHAQDTASDHTAPPTNSSDACKLLIYTSEAKTPSWRLSLCGGNAASLASKAGIKLLPSKIRIVWNPPTKPYYHTEKLRLVVTAVNSGAVCNNDTQFSCGATGLCISTTLLCDGVRHCSGAEDEEPGMCSRRRDPPFVELLRRFAARNQELLGVGQPEGMTKPSVISDLKLPVKVTEGEQKSGAFAEFAAALKPYGPWSYLVVGMLVCAVILMFCLAWECCCKRSKPSETPLNIPASCLDMSPTVSVTAASQQLFTQHADPSPPEYESPPSYSSLFPRAFKSSPTPVPHCSHQEPPD